MNHLKSWLKDNCPNLWSLLNSPAQNVLPRGLLEYLSPPSASYLNQIREKFPEFSEEFPHQIAESQAAQGQENLILAEKRVQELISICGFKTVGDAYRRDLSGVSSTKQVAELFCEITLSTAVSKLSSIPPQLRPPSGKGSRCDVCFHLAGSAVYGEVKRYEDTWFSDLSPSRADQRALIRTSPGTPPQGRRPRAMDLASKLQDVPRQFPEGTINFLFIFHPSFGDSYRYLQQALFGESALFEELANVSLRQDGLFANDEWRIISGCSFVKVLFNGELICPFTWENPRALAPIPAAIRVTLNSLKSQGVSLEQP